VRAATQQVEDALLQEYDQIAGGVSKYALLAQKYGLDSESSFMHKMRRARARRQSAEATSTISVHEAMARLAAIQAARVGQERKQADPSGSKPRAREQAKEDALLVRYEELLVHWSNPDHRASGRRRHQPSTSPRPEKTSGHE